jgi:hypothetical protein
MIGPKPICAGCGVLLSGFGQPMCGAGLRERQGKKYIRACPFEGHDDASMSLQLAWMAGWFDAFTRRHSKNLKRKNLRPRRIARTRWPRSEYARRRLELSLRGARA